MHVTAGAPDGSRAPRLPPQSAARTARGVHLRLGLLTAALYALLVTVGLAVRSTGSPIDLGTLLLGPCAPLVYTVLTLAAPAAGGEPLFGLVTLVPAAAWILAARRPRHVWLEVVAALCLLALHALLLFALGMSA